MRGVRYARADVGSAAGCASVEPLDGEARIGQPKAEREQGRLLARIPVAIPDAEIFVEANGRESAAGIGCAGVCGGRDAGALRFVGGEGDGEPAAGIGVPVKKRGNET